MTSAAQINRVLYVSTKPYNRITLNFGGEATGYATIKGNCCWCRGLVDNHNCKPELYADIRMLASTWLVKLDDRLQPS